MNPRQRFGRPILLKIMLLGGSMLLGIQPVLADCQAHYNQAVGLLDEVQQRIANNEKPSPDAFAAEFKALVDKMQAERCLPEVMSLLQHIQNEQQKYPAPANAPDRDPSVD